MPVIKGTVRWASLAKPNKMSGKYQLDVCNLSKAAVEQLKEQGVTTLRYEKKSDDELGPRGNFLTMRSNAETKAGKIVDPPEVVDAKKKPLPRGVLVGNGSVVKVVYDTFPWTFKGKAGVSAGLRVVQVLKLEEYEGGEFSTAEELEEEEGFEGEGDGTDELDDDDDGDDEGAETDDDIPL